MEVLSSRILLRPTDSHHANLEASRIPSPHPLGMSRFSQDDHDTSRELSGSPSASEMRSARPSELSGSSAR